jgi:D-sedoheptulose 7-phosphate isomerase
MASVVFTNGCFDILHPGHVDLLKRAKALGDKLVVGINSDHSVRNIKGPERPFFNQEARKALLLGLDSVDEVLIFDELTPDKLIRKIKPDVLVKGGDWTHQEIIGADFVEEHGGKVYSLPIVNGYSSTKIIDSIKKSENAASDSSEISDGLTEHLEVFTNLISSHLPVINACAEILAGTFESGHKILICGNGGSAADAQHIAAEFVGRYERERKALPAIALTTDTSALTALANDYSFDLIYSRQIEALANENDCLVAISTSGNSPNVIAAVMAARRIGCKVIGLTGSNGKKLASLCDAVVMVPSERTSRVQEAHIAIAHYWCEVLEL